MPEPAGTIPYRFRNGQWEELGKDDTTWGPVDGVLAAILAPYASVKRLEGKRLAFTTGDGRKTITSEIVNQMYRRAIALRPPEGGEPQTTPVATLSQEEKDARAYGYSRRDWPPMTQAPMVDNPKYRDAAGLVVPGQPEKIRDPDFVPVPDVALMDAWADYAWQQEQRAAVEEPRPLIFGSKGEAEKEAAANGGVVFRRSDGLWGVKDAPVPPTPPTDRPQTFEEAFTGYLLSGQTDKASQLWDAREAIISGGGRMTRFQAAQLLMGNDLFKAEEIPTLLDALMGGPEQPARGAFQQALEERRLPGPGGEPGNIEAGGFFGPTRQETPPFPAVPGLPAPEPFGATASPQDVLGAFLKGTQPRKVPQFGPGQRPGLGLEEFDPSFESASPEAQAQIRAELARRQGGAFPFSAAGGPSTAGQGSFTKAIQEDLEGVTNQQHTQLQAATVGTRAPQTQFKMGNRSFTLMPEEARAPLPTGFPTPRGQAQAGVLVPEGMNPWDEALRLSQTPQGLATAAAIRAVPAEERTRMAEEARASAEERANVGQGPQPGMTFAQALAQINERRRHQQLLRKPQGRTLFA